MFDYYIVLFVVCFVLGLIAPTASGLIRPTASEIIAPTASEISAGGNPLDFPQTPFEQGNTASLRSPGPLPGPGALPLDPTGAAPLDPAVVVRSLCGGRGRAGWAGGGGSGSHAQPSKEGAFTITIIGNQTNQSINQSN